MTNTLLPIPRQVFYSMSGAPLAGGKVYTYVPGGSTPKNTWQDAAGTILNTNPITLDSAGSCVIYGSGDYQITAQDSLGNSVPAYSGLSEDTSFPLAAVNASISALSASLWQFATATGTADAITAAYASPNASLTDGLKLGFRASAANATTTPTFAPDGLSSAVITYAGGQALVPGAIPAVLAEMMVRYNLANNRWELLNPAVPPRQWAVAGGTSDVITLALGPSIPAYYDGLRAFFRATAANTTTTPTVNVNGLGAKVITKFGGTALNAGDIPGALAEVQLVYNAANNRFEYMNAPVPRLAVQGTFKNLKVVATAGAATVTATVDEIILETASQSYATGRAVSVSINSGTAGAGGLDTGTVAASTWYSVWIIYNGSAYAGLLSTGVSAPTSLPSGYIYYSRVGFVKTSATAAQFQGSLQYNRNAQWTVDGTVLTAFPLIAGGGIANNTSTAWAAFAPSTASRLDLTLVGLNSTAGNAQIGPNANVLVGMLWAMVNAGGTMATSLIPESANVFIGTGSNGRVYVRGWEDNL